MYRHIYMQISLLLVLVLETLSVTIKDSFTFICTDFSSSSTVNTANDNDNDNKNNDDDNNIPINASNNEHISQNIIIILKALQRSSWHNVIKNTTKTGPTPLPRSSVRLKIANAVPLHDGVVTFCKIDLTFGPVIETKKPSRKAIM